VEYPYCEKFGFDETTIRSRLTWLELDYVDYVVANQLQELVIAPNSQNIIDDFYDYLDGIEESKPFLTDKETVDRLKITQKNYLENLGVNFGTLGYFESRLRVGQAHVWIGLSLSLYQCAYRFLSQIISENIPVDCDIALAKQLREFIQKITALDMSLAIETYHATHVQTLEESLDRAHVQENQLRIEASTDALTGLYNHEHILSILSQTMKEDALAGQSTSVMMADLDHFKEINDTHGHPVGDKVLMEVSRRLGAALRDFDNLGRYGGEEYLIVLKNTPLSTTLAVAERVREHISAGPVSLHGPKVTTTISIGVAVAQPGDDADTIVERADKALYEAKAAGRNCVKSAN
jgi:two-component system cell cycle response regulator